MKFSNQLKICFALFEKIDHWVIAGLINDFRKNNFPNIRIINGISYDDYIRKNKRYINARNYPLAISENKINLRQAKTPREKLLRFLLDEKIHSLETRILFKRIVFEMKRISKACREKYLFIIPEDTDAARGRLVAILAKAYGCKAFVSLPLYYDWIATYPLKAHRLADYWVTRGNNYCSRLLGEGLRRNRIHRKAVCLAQKNCQKNSGKSRIKKILNRNYYLVTLQNNDEQELAIQFVIDAIRLVPDKSVIFKYHPSTPAKTKKYLKNQYGSSSACFTDDMNLDEAIRRSNGVITISSTTILNAVYYDKPVMVIDVGFFFHELYLLAERTKAFDIIDNPQRLAGLFTSLDDKGFRTWYIKNQQRLKKDYLDEN